MQLSREQKEAMVKKVGRFQRTFKGSDGEYVLDDLDKTSRYKESTFDADPYIHAYKAGQRAMVVYIHAIIDQDFELAKRILKQEKENEQTRKM